jgi:hypothetical protein
MSWPLPKELARYLRPRLPDDPHELLSLEIALHRLPEVYRTVVIRAGYGIDLSWPVRYRYLSDLRSQVRALWRPDGQVVHP